MGNKYPNYSNTYAPTIVCIYRQDNLWLSLYTLGILSVMIYRTHKKRSGVDEKGLYPRSIHFEIGYVLNLDGWDLIELEEGTQGYRFL